MSLFQCIDFEVCIGAEGGADRWARRKVPDIGEQVDSIVFQQIDITDFYEGNGVFGVRLFGVTEVRKFPFPLGCCLIATVLYSERK